MKGGSALIILDQSYRTTDFAGRAAEDNQVTARTRHRSWSLRGAFNGALRIEFDYC